MNRSVVWRAAVLQVFMFDVGFPVSRLSLDFSVIPCVPYNTKHVALTYSHVEVRIRLNFKRFVIQKTRAGVKHHYSNYFILYSEMGTRVIEWHDKMTSL